MRKEWQDREKDGKGKMMRGMDVRSNDKRQLRERGEKGRKGKDQRGGGNDKRLKRKRREGKVER